MKQNARKPLAALLSAVMLAATAFSAGAVPLTGRAEDGAGEAVRVNPLEVNSSQPRYLRGDLTVYTDTGSIEGNLEESGGFTNQGLFDNKKETGARSQEMSGDKAISESSPFWFSFKLQKAQPSRAPMACAVTTYALVSVNGAGDAAENKACDPRDWKFYGSKDGNAWVLLDAQTGQEFTQRGEQKTYTFQNSEAYAYYKLEVTQNWGQDGAGGNPRTGLAGIRVGLGADIDLTSLAGLYWNQGGEWGASATEAQKTETMAAFSTEYNRQMDLYNYNIGVSGRVHNQGNTTGVQCESVLSDNVTSPWTADRKWAQMSAPYAGMAFTVKGYMAKGQPDGNSGAALGNQVALEADDGSVWYYQTFRNQTWKVKADGSMAGPEKVNVGVGAGAANDTIKKAMEYAYAESAWNLMNPGFNREQGAQVEGDVTYQAFYGYDSTGKAGEETGISYIAGLTSGASGAYVVANDIFNAWQETWSDDGKFAATGAPTSSAALDADGNLRQSFEKVIFVQDKNTGEIRTIKNESAISDFSLGGGVEVVRSVSSKLSATESRTVYIVKDGADVTALAPTYTGTGVTPTSGSVQDFTGSYDNPIAYVTSPSGGQSNTLYITVLTESQAAAADQAVLLLKSRLDLLPEEGKVAKTDRSLIVLAKAEYAAMDETQRFLLGDAYAAKLDAAEKALLAEEKDHKLRILCVGSSTTEGVGASSGSFSYPSQLQSLLGTSGYTVINKGVSGTTVADQGGNPYRQTARYRESLQSSPDLVLMFVGSNDAEYSAWNRSDIDYPAHFRDCYVSLLNEYKALDSQPTVVVTYPYRTFGWASRDVLVPDAILPMLTEIAGENDCPILDLYEATNFGQLSENPRDLMPDGLHPNDAGYARIAQAAAQFVGAYTEADLSELKAGDTAVALADGVYEYAVQAAGSYPAVTAKAADPAAEVEITQAAADKPYAEIRVTAGKYTARYRLDFAADAAGGAGQALSADIAKMGRVSYDNLEQFKALRARYDGLTAAQKAHVRNEYDLGIAELTVNELDVNAQAVKPVTEKIDALGDYNTPDKTPAVREARAAYRTLTAAQQALVSNIDRLIAAEAKVPEVDPVYYATEQLGRLGAAASYRDAPVVGAMVPFLASMKDEDKAKLDAGLLQKLEAAKRAVDRSDSAFTLTVNDATWRTSGYTKTPWMHNVTAEEKRATADAMADELKYEYVVNGYAVGRISGSYNIDSGWGDLPLIQIDGENGSVETDNVTRPWASQTGRYWAMVTAPFVGMSFSQKGYFASGDTGEAALGNSFSYQGKVYQVYWGSVRSHDDVALEKNKEVAVSTSPSFPGSNGRYDITNNTFRYAYAAYSQANKWESGTLGLPAGPAAADEKSGVIYQAFAGPAGPAYIAGAAETIAAADAEGGKPLGAYAVPAAVAAALANEAGDDASRFAKVGAPLSDARTEDGVTLQAFEKFDVRVKADGSYTLTPHGQQPEPDFVPGDLDKSGEVTIQDVMEACKVLARQSAGKAPTDEEMLLGDLDGDKKFTITDVMEICKILARKA